MKVYLYDLVMVVKRNEALKRALKAAGGLTLLATQLGITPQAISQWLRVPAVRVLEVEKAVRGSVSRHDMRPDLYPKEEPDRHRTWPGPSAKW